MVGPVYTRTPPVNRPHTHAFIIGVGAYPDAKYGRGEIDELRTVKDLPSAADSARYMVDWLIKNQDLLAAPLASIHLLISDPVTPANVKRYVWENPYAFDPATSVNVKAHGQSWLKHLTARQNDVALFYACGHGGSLSTEPVVFLEDLNAENANIWAHHNIGATAQSFKQLANIQTGFFFADTCREFVPKFELASAQDLSRFAAAWNPFAKNGTDKISLLCGTSDTQLSYEGQTLADPNLRLGRFTQILTKALEGASARQKGTGWVVHAGALIEDLKLLSRLYRPDWRKEAFEPSLPIVANFPFPITHPTDPMLPVVIYTDPESASANYDLRIFDNATLAPPPMNDRGPRAPGYWLTEVKGALALRYAVAQDDNAGVYQQIFVPNAPIFDHRITVQ